MNRVAELRPTSPAPDRPGDAEQAGDFADLAMALRMLWGGKWIIASAAVAAMAGGLAYGRFVSTPQYRASASVMLETRREQVVDLNGMLDGFSGDTTDVNSQIEVLRSRGLMEKVVAALDLANDPEFNSNLREPSALEATFARLSGALTAPDEPEGAANRLTATNTVETLLAKTTIRRIPSSLVFEILAETTDPEKSARIANAVAEQYVEDQLDMKFRSTERAISWLTQRVSELKAELENAEARAADFKAGSGLVGPETLSASERQMKDLRERIATTQSKLEAAQGRRTALESLAREDRPAQAALSTDRALLQLLPLVQAGDRTAQERFDARFDSLLVQARDDADQARAQSAALEAAAAALESKMARQSEELIEWQQLSREAEASRLLYEHFLGRLKEMAAQQGIHRPDSRILSQAMAPQLPSSPRISLMLLLSGAGGAALGAALSLVRAARRAAFRSAGDLEAATGGTVMGQIPRFRRPLLGRLAGHPPTRQDPAVDEAFRDLRTSILYSEGGHPCQVIMVTSSLPGDGKTTISLSLARTLADLGKKTLLIEGDIRGCDLAERLNCKTGAGLASVVAGTAAIEEAVCPDPVTGADMLPGQPSRENPADLFSSPAFRQFVARMRSGYDLILIDVPPVLAAPDARVVAPLSDAILFVVKWNATPQSAVREALRLLGGVGQQVSGFVLNGVEGTACYGYGPGYGSYARATGLQPPARRA